MLPKWIRGAADNADAGKPQAPQNNAEAVKPQAPREAPEPPAAATLPLQERPKPMIPGLTEVVVKPSVLSDAMSIHGEIRTKGALHIDGHASGSIDAGSVTVGAGGIFEGTVRCGKLHVKGIFSGNGTCEDLIIADEAQVAVGSLTFRTIAVHRGARVAGDLIPLETT